MSFGQQQQESSFPGEVVRMFKLISEFQFWQFLQHSWSWIDKQFCFLSHEIANLRGSADSHFFGRDDPRWPRRGRSKNVPFAKV